MSYLDAWEWEGGYNINLQYEEPLHVDGVLKFKNCRFLLENDQDMI